MKEPKLLLKTSALAALVAALVLSQRGRAAAPLDQFEVEGDVVTDTKTGLIWQKALGMKEASFELAQSYCADLNLGDSSAWRAPSIKELQTLVDDETLGEPTAHEQASFDPIGNDDHIWSSTLVAGRPGEAWDVDFLAGLPRRSDSTELKAVRCVR